MVMIVIIDVFRNHFSKGNSSQNSRKFHDFLAGTGILEFWFPQLPGPKVYSSCGHSRMPRTLTIVPTLNTRTRRVLAFFLSESTLREAFCSNPRILEAIISDLNRRERRTDGRPRPPVGLRLDFSNLPDDSFNLFRFDVDHLDMLAQNLGLPEVLRTPHRDRVPRREALAIVLRRLSYPCTLREMRNLFGRGEGPISEIWHFTIDFLWSRWRHLLEGLDVRRLASLAPLFASAIQGRGAPLPYVFGFVDGTLRPICRSCCPVFFSFQLNIKQARLWTARLLQREGSYPRTEVPGLDHSGWDPGSHGWSLFRETTRQRDVSLVCTRIQVGRIECLARQRSLHLWRSRLRAQSSASKTVSRQQPFACTYSIQR